MQRFCTHRKMIVFTVALSILGFVASSHAEDMGGAGGGMKDGHEHGACKADVQKFCANVTPGKGAIRDCLKQHEADLSQGCKDNIAKMKAHMKEKMVAINKACKTDEDQYCKDVTPGEGREMACLHAHNDKISQGCKDTLKSMHHHHHIGGNGEGHEAEGGQAPAK